MRTMILATLVVAQAAGAGTLATRPSVLGVWSNPKGTLAVRTQPCGPADTVGAAALCGAIVRAEPKAVADARDAGVVQLIGTQLLQDYRPIGRASWSGRVFVPDMGRSFSSRIRQTSPDALTISGCLIGGMFCKSQEWHRVG